MNSYTSDLIRNFQIVAPLMRQLNRTKLFEEGKKLETEIKNNLKRLRYE